MENKAEDEIRKKWEQEAKEKAQQEEEEEVAQPGRKRLRAIGYRGVSDSVLTDAELATFIDGKVERSMNAAKTRGGASKTRRAAGTRAKARITETTEDDVEEILELD